MTFSTRQRGGVAIFTVLAASLLIGAFVLSGSAALAPRTLEIRHSRTSDQAWALAEAGATAAIVELEADPTWSGCQDVALGQGSLTVRVSQRDGQVFVVSRGTWRHGELEQSRRITVRLTIHPGGRARVLDWLEQ